MAVSSSEASSKTPEFEITNKRDMEDVEIEPYERKTNSCILIFEVGLYLIEFVSFSNVFQTSRV